MPELFYIETRRAGSFFNIGAMGFHGERGLGAAFGGMGDRREVAHERHGDHRDVSHV